VTALQWESIKPAGSSPDARHSHAAVVMDSAQGVRRVTVRERSGVYWKPKGAAAERAGPSAISPQSCPLIFGGRCHAMDFEGIWGRC